MATTKNYRAWLAGAAIGLLLALFGLPATRPLVRLQVGQVLGSTTDMFGKKPVPASIAIAHPDDVQIQLATAQAASQSAYFSTATSGVGADYVGALKSVQMRFPNEPVVYANALRILCLQRLIRSRPENSLVFGLKPPSDSGPQTKDGFPYAFFDHTAIMGERLDPNNAYFPMMHAASLFGQHKDAAAMAAYHQASLKPYWREYYSEEVYGNWKKWDLALGMRSAIMHEAIFESLLLPHYPEFRQTARIELYKAMLAERSGNIQQGLAIRLDIMRCGSLMRSQSTSIIGSLVGIAVFRTGLANLGGRPESADSRDVYSDQASQQLFVDFCKYLLRNNDANLVKPVTAEYDAGKPIYNAGLDDFQIENRIPGLLNLVALWTVDLLILATVVILLISGGLATAALHILKLSPVVAISRQLRFPLIIGLFLGLGIFILSGTPSRHALVASLSFAIVLASSIVWACWRLGRHDAAKVLPLALPIGLTIFLFASIAAFELGKCNDAVALGMAMDYRMPGNFAGEVIDHWNWTGAVLFFLPITIICLVSLVLSLIRKNPILTGILAGFSKSALPTACILTLVYGGVFLGTISQERLVNFQVDEQTANEGKCLANAAGQTWPAATDWPTTEITDAPK